MKIEGGCYCGAVRYRAQGEPSMRAQCHCRECQYITGGGPNFLMMMPADGFARTDIARPVTRQFCPDCGTHLVTRLDGFPAVVVKVGTMDDPLQFGAPQVALFTCDRQAFHEIALGIAQFERMPF
ncbi:MAG: GFA family protein [Alphaproteobacteria bacterium]|nr:GFA family protein [Alphaproteobacteria bacterium]